LEKKKSIADKAERKLFARAGRLLRRQDSLLCPRSQSRLQTLLASYEQLRVVYNYRQSLQNIWLKTAASQKELVESLQHWCRQAEESGLDVLHQFAQQIKAFVPRPVKV